MSCRLGMSEDGTMMTRGVAKSPTVVSGAAAPVTWRPASPSAYSYLSKLSQSLSGRLSLALASDEETGMGRGTGHMFTQIQSEMEADCVLSPSRVGRRPSHSLPRATCSSTSALRPAVPSPAIPTKALVLSTLPPTSFAIWTSWRTFLPKSRLQSRSFSKEYREWYNGMYGECSAEVIPAISVHHRRRQLSICDFT